MQNLSYRQVLKLNFSLFNTNPSGLECFRQWIVLLGSIVAIPFLILAIRRIRRFTRSFTLDKLILGMETAKVIEYDFNLFS